MTRFRAAFTAFSLVACAAAAVFCGSAGLDDGASCDTSKDCKSGACTGGACAGSACSCDAGVCDGGGVCQAGWLCVDYTNQAGVTPAMRCERTCTGPGTCPADRHCERGVCKDGPETLAVAWKKAPSDVRCQVFTNCTFEVDVISGDVARFDWDFGEADAGVTTTDASATHKYTTVGSHDVKVVVTDKNDKTFDLNGTANVCTDGTAIACAPGFAECCQGVCTPEAGTCL